MLDTCSVDEILLLHILRIDLFHLCFSLLNNAFEEQLAFQRALKEYVGSLDPTYAKETEELFVAFEGSFGNKHVTPRTLMSRFLGNLICVEGIVTKCKWFVFHDRPITYIWKLFLLIFYACNNTANVMN
jgi:DNA replicative helicase MCM subunit Mcm2 (Cdc46/Mcm family)